MFLVNIVINTNIPDIDPPNGLQATTVFTINMLQR